MLETYSKPCQISKMMGHIENPGIARTVYSGIFRYSGTFSKIQQYSGRLRDIKAYWDIFRHYCGILSHIQACSELCITLAYKTVPYSEPWCF